jgi:hypothetical protein
LLAINSFLVSTDLPDSNIRLPDSEKTGVKQIVVYRYKENILLTHQSLFVQLKSTQVLNKLTSGLEQHTILLYLQL